MNFGRVENNLFLFRINGNKAEIEKAIQELKDLGLELITKIEYEKSHKHLSVLVKFYIPEDLLESRGAAL